MADVVTKIGPFGGPGGTPWGTIDGPPWPKQLVSVQVWSIDSPKYGEGVINGFGFYYVDAEEKTVHSGPHGPTNGTYHPIDLDLTEDEHVVKVSGTTDGIRVTSLTFVTDKDNKYGPYGAQKDDGLTHFNIPENSKRGIFLAFFGRSSEKLDAIGAYVRQRAPAA